MVVALNSGAFTNKSKSRSTKDGSNNKKRSSTARQVQRIYMGSLLLMCLVFLGLYNNSKLLPKPSDYNEFNYGGMNATANANANADADAFTPPKLTMPSIEPPQPKPKPQLKSIVIEQPPYTFIDDELVAWRTNRSRSNNNNHNYFNSWFVNGEGNGALNPKNADFQGPILDFAIAGFPKCGTTALMRNLAPVTTMPPETDICTPVDQTTYYAYKNWPSKYGRYIENSHNSSSSGGGGGANNNNTNNTTTNKELKFLKGSKCPRVMETADLTDFGSKLPKTRLIVGIRHPVLWFQSFFNMQIFNRQRNLSSLEFLYIQKCSPHEKKKALPKRSPSCDAYGCHNKKDLICVARSRFHLPLARMGKTARGKEEQELLVSEIIQAKKRIHDNSTTLFPIQMENISNHIFLYESGQPKEEYFWQQLAEFVRINRTDLPEEQGYRMGNGLNTENANVLEKQKKSLMFDICEPQYDHLRQELMPIAYTLQKWLRQYFIPASKVRDDVVIPNVDKFEEIVTNFQKDPCNRLIRNDTDGEYYVDPNL